MWAVKIMHLTLTVYTSPITLYISWKNKAVHMPVRDWNRPKQNLKHSLCCAQQCWESSSFNRNSHLVNLSDAAFRHQWTGTDNVVQPAGHNLYENIRCYSLLLDHCPSNDDAPQQYTPGTGRFCASALFWSTIVSPCYFDAIKMRWVKWMLGEATIDCRFYRSRPYILLVLTPCPPPTWGYGGTSMGPSRAPPPHCVCSALVH